MKSQMMLVMTMSMLMTMAVATVTATAVAQGEVAGQPPPVPAEEQSEVLTSGPLNEAFAQPVSLDDRDEGLTAPIEPPPDIEEIPPVQRPSGDQFVWVPGYWAWDSERNDYIWVSGCWRAPPPDMYWLPGYWARTAEGWRWVPGCWVPVANKEVEYLPAPPALTNVGPPGPPPSADVIWVPPCWYWSYGKYLYRRGYWLAAQPDWIWVPSHYVWTPRGYVFAHGYWDYTLHRRGVLFAPIYFPRRIHHRHHRFSHRLAIAINLAHLEFVLFTRPRYSHYYFGDYYDSSYIEFGIFPWFESEWRHTWYDPVYKHARWRHHRNEPRWEHQQRWEYEHRRTDKTLRPPRTYNELKKKREEAAKSQRTVLDIATPITTLTKEKTRMFNFEPVKPQAREQLSRHAGDVHSFGRERSHWETQTQQGVRVGSPGGHILLPEREKPAEPVKGKRHQAIPVEPKKMPKRTEPEQVPPLGRPGRGVAPGRAWERTTTPSGQQRSQTISPPPHKTQQSQSDKVKIRTSPVIGKRIGELLKKRPPTQPEEEEKDKR